VNFGASKFVIIRKQARRRQQEPHGRWRKENAAVAKAMRQFSFLLSG
jgi:hypothetical protein